MLTGRRPTVVDVRSWCGFGCVPILVAHMTKATMDSIVTNAVSPVLAHLFGYFNYFRMVVLLVLLYLLQCIGPFSTFGTGVHIGGYFFMTVVAMLFYTKSCECFMALRTFHN